MTQPVPSAAPSAPTSPAAPAPAPVAPSVSGSSETPAKTSPGAAVAASVGRHPLAPAPAAEVEAPAPPAEAPKVETLADRVNRAGERQAARRREAAALRAERERVAQSRTKYEQLVERAEKDPLEWLANERKLTTDDIVKKKLAEQAADTPEARIAKLEADYSAKIKALEEKYEAEQRTRQQATTERMKAESEAGFLRIAKAEDQYPALNALMDDHEITSEAWSVLTQAASALRQRYPGISATELQNLLPTDKEVADYLEQRAKPKYTKLAGKLGRPAPPIEATGPGKTTDSVRSAPTPTLSNRGASERITGDLPYHKLSREQQLARDIEVYERNLRR